MTVWPLLPSGDRGSGLSRPPALVVTIATGWRGWDGNVRPLLPTQTAGSGDGNVPQPPAENTSSNQTPAPRVPWLWRLERAMWSGTEFLVSDKSRWVYPTTGRCNGTPSVFLPHRGFWLHGAPPQRRGVSCLTVESTNRDDRHQQRLPMHVSSMC